MNDSSLSDASRPSASIAEVQSAGDALATLLERAADLLGVPVDTDRCYRVVRQAEAARPGAWDATWMHRVPQCARELGMRGEAIALDAVDVERCLAGSQLLLRWGTLPDRSSGWLLAFDQAGNWVEAQLGSGEMIRLRYRELNPGGSNGAHPDVWCLLAPLAAGFDAPEDGGGGNPPPEPGGSGDGHHGPRPLARLVGLVRRDRADLWTVLVFALVIGMLSLAVPITAELLVGTVAFGNVLQPILVLTVILGGTLAFAACLQAAQNFVVEIMQRRLFVRVASDLAYRLPRVSATAWDQQHGPELVNRFFDVLTVQKVGASLLLDALSLVILALVSMLVLAFYHPFLLGYDLLLCTLIVFALTVMGRGAVATSISESRSKYAVAGWLEEIARHPTAFKVAGGPEFAWRRTDRLVKEYLGHRKSHYRILFRQISFSLGLQAFAMATLLGLGGWLVIDRTLTLGQLVAAQLLVSNVVSAFTKLGKHIEGYYDLMAAVEKLGHLLDLPLEPSGGDRTARQRGPASIQLRGVRFAYDERGDFELRLDARIERGESVALRGPAGSGKSSLLELLFGLRTPQAGQILIDGENVRQWSLESLREEVAVVQEIEIFAGTVAENLTIDRRHVTREDVRSALEIVGLNDEIARLPMGLGTRLSTGGAPLSASQAVRLNLARAIAGRPRALLLDETLDRLPPQSRDELLKQLTAPGRGWTLVVATQLDAVAARCGRTILLPAAGSRHA